MNRIRIFAQQAAVGNYVTLRLTRGADVSGLVTSLDSSHICLDINGTIVTVFEDILAGWEIHAGSQRQEPRFIAAVEEELDIHHVEKSPVTITSESEGDEDSQQTTSLGEPRLGSDDQTLVTQEESEASKARPTLGLGDGDNHDNQKVPTQKVQDNHDEIAILSIQARVKATFDEATRHAKVEAPEPDFTFPESEFRSGSELAVKEARKDWDRASSQYRYALKIRELSRLSDIVRQTLKPLDERFPQNAAVKSLMGRILLKQNMSGQARSYLSASASASPETADYWKALAYAAGLGTGLECYALRRYFQETPPQYKEMAWFRYLVLAESQGDLPKLARIVKKWHKKDDPKLREFLGESVLYLLLNRDSEMVAREGARLLESGGVNLPDGWESELSRDEMPPDSDLREIEESFTRTATGTAAGSARGDFPHGRITAFGAQGFGFIDGHAGEVFFFRAVDVTDEGLKQALLGDKWRSRSEVEFEVLSPYAKGQRYSRAVNICPIRDNSALLKRATSLVRLNRHDQALGLLRRVLSSNPEHEEANDLRTRVLETMRDSGMGLPKGDGPYAMAKRAQLMDRDLPAAEHLFRKAIKERDKRESATKDLASLLQQQGRHS